VPHGPPARRGAVQPPLPPARCESIGTVTASPAVRLVLWDVDRTLLTAGGIGRRLYEHAFAAVTGRAPAAVADMAGRTEHAIAADTLRLNGVAPDPELLARFHAALEALHRLGAVQTVVTGNIRELAAAKLAAFGLEARLDLSLGGYGDHSPDRADLVRLAVARATQRHGAGFAPSAVVVVGDTPHDVRGAHDAGVRAVGVATGRSSRADLAAAGADGVLDDLRDTAAVVRLLAGVTAADARRH